MTENEENKKEITTPDILKEEIGGDGLPPTEEDEE